MVSEIRPIDREIEEEEREDFEYGFPFIQEFCIPKLKKKRGGGRLVLVWVWNILVSYPNTCIYVVPRNALLPTRFFQPASRAIIGI